MNKNLKLRFLTTPLIILILINSLILFASSEIIEIENSKNLPLLTGDTSYTNISVQEAWQLLTDTSNGIQIPIDVRTEVEWMYERIDTPEPENSRNHCVCEWGDINVVQDFINLYEGKEIVLYCVQGFRSFDAVNILLDNGFSGTIYNMYEGITGWKNAGYPTKLNQPPQKPVISGKHKGNIEKEYQYFISSIDPEGGDIYYYINWSDGSETQYIGPYPSAEEVAVNHTWLEEKTFAIKVIALDGFQAESDMATFEVSMPKSKLIFNQMSIFIEMLREIFPILFNAFF